MFYTYNTNSKAIMLAIHPKKQYYNLKLHTKLVASINFSIFVSWQKIKLRKISLTIHNKRSR